MLPLLFVGFQEFQYKFQELLSIPWWLVLLLATTLFSLWEFFQHMKTPEWESKWRKTILTKVKTMRDEAFWANKEMLQTWPHRKRLAMARSYISNMPITHLRKVRGIGPVLLRRIQDLGYKTLGEADERLMNVTRIGPIIYQGVVNYIPQLVEEAFNQMELGKLKYSDLHVEKLFDEEKRRYLERQDLLTKDVEELLQYEEKVREYEKQKALITPAERLTIAKRNLVATLLNREHTLRFLILFALTIILFYSLPLWLILFGGGIKYKVGYLCAWSGFLGICVVLISYFGLSKIRLNLGLRDPDPHEFQEQRLQFQALQLSDRLNISPPEVRILNEKSYNAFASGTSKTKSLVCFHSSLVRDFRNAEVEGILGHELSHLHHNDCRINVTYNHVVTIFSLLQMIALSLGIGFINAASSVPVSRRKGAGGAALVGLGLMAVGLFVMLCYIVLYGARFTAILLKFAISRQAEYRADLSSAELLGKQKMIAALEHLRDSPEPSNIFPSVRSSLTIDPSQQMRHATKFAESILATHPPLSKRIEALKTMKIP